MPSQISLRTPPVLSNSGARVGHKAVISRNPADENGMKAATRTVGSILNITHNSIIKPHSKNFNGSCGKTDNLDLTSKGFKPTFNSNGTTAVTRNLGANHFALGTMEHVNNKAAPVVLCNSASPKTEGKHSNEESSFTNQSRGRLMCPELAISYTGTLVDKRSKSLANKQYCLENRVASLQRKVRFRQLNAVHSHASKQLHFDGSMNQEQESLNVEDGSASSFNTDCSMEVSPVVCRKKVLPLPIQVDGASDDPFLPYQQEVVKVEGEGGKPECYGGVGRTEDSFSSLESYSSGVSSEAEVGCAQALSAQMTSLQGLLNGDWTESSSDEEDESADPHYRLAWVI